MNTNNFCPHCGHRLSDNTSNMICMHCGHSVTPQKKFDNVDANKTGQKNENTMNVLVSSFVSLGALWWVLLIIGVIVTSIVSIVSAVFILFLF